MAQYQPTGVPFKKPLKFTSVEELVKQIDAYFESLYDYARDMWGNRMVDKEAKPDPDNPDAKVYVMKKVKVATVTGLAVFLDTTRETLLDYESGKYDDRDAEGKSIELTVEQQEYNAQVQKYSDTIKRAKLMIYDDTEQQLFISGRSSGAIFSLKNNYQWQDKTQQELTNPDGSLSPLAGMRTDELRDYLVRRNKSD